MRSCRIPRGQEKFLAIMDLKGWGYANCDVRAYIAAIEIMQVRTLIASLLFHSTARTHAICNNRLLHACLHTIRQRRRSLNCLNMSNR